MWAIYYIIPICHYTINIFTIGIVPNPRQVGTYGLSLWLVSFVFGCYTIIALNSLCLAVRMCVHTMVPIETSGISTCAARSAAVCRFFTGVTQNVGCIAYKNTNSILALLHTAVINMCRMQVLAVLLLLVVEQATYCF